MQRTYAIGLAVIAMGCGGAGPREDVRLDSGASGMRCFADSGWTVDAGWMVVDGASLPHDGAAPMLDSGAPIDAASAEPGACEPWPFTWAVDVVPSCEGSDDPITELRFFNPAVGSGACGPLSAGPIMFVAIHGTLDGIGPASIFSIAPGDARYVGPGDATATLSGTVVVDAFERGVPADSFVYEGSRLRFSYELHGPGVDQAATGVETTWFCVGAPCD
jgi:hypothetical protein